MLRKLSIFNTCFFLLLIKQSAVTVRNICAVYEEGAIAERTARDWYAKFKNENFDLTDACCYGRPVEFDKERLSKLLQKILV